MNFERVINDVIEVDLKSNDDHLSLFLESLMKSCIRERKMRIHSQSQYYLEKTSFHLRN